MASGQTGLSGREGDILISFVPVELTPPTTDSQPDASRGVQSVESADSRPPVNLKPTRRGSVMSSSQSSLLPRFEKRLWQTRPEQLPAPAAFAIKAMRVTVAVIRDLLEGQITLRSMGMVYSTLLSLVPLLAISFSLMKGLGVVDNKLEPMLLNLVAPMGVQGEEIVTQTPRFR